MQVVNSWPKPKPVHEASATPQPPEDKSTPLIPSTSCPAPLPDQSTVLSARSITAEDSGKILVIHQTDRFSVYLDDRLYPLSTLQASPAGRLGIISNGSLRGPDCYPLMFEAVTEGDALLSDRDFHLRVVVDDHAPISPFPLH